MFTISHRYNKHIYYHENQKIDPAAFFYYRKQPECVIRDDRNGEDHSWQNMNSPKIFDWLLERNFLKCNIYSDCPMGIRIWMISLEEESWFRTDHQTMYEKFYRWAIREKHLDLAEHLLTRIS